MHTIMKRWAWMQCNVSWLDPVLDIGWKHITEVPSPGRHKGLRTHVFLCYVAMFSISIRDQLGQAK